MGLTRLQFLITAALLALAVILRIADPAPVARLRASIFDTYLDFAPRKVDPAYPVRIVDIDEASLARLGQWPWPRSQLADLITKLTASGAKVIAIDLLLAEPDRMSPQALARQLQGTPDFANFAQAARALPSNDERLAAAIAKGPVVLGFSGGKVSTQQPPKPKAGFAAAGDDPARFAPPFPGSINPLAELSAGAAGLGGMNWLPERDQIVRRVPLLFSIGGKLYPSLSLEALRIGTKASTVMVKASGGSGITAFGAETGIELVRTGDVTLPSDHSGQLWLKFSRTDPQRYISAYKVLEDEFDVSQFANRHIFIGASASGLLDLRATPLETAVPGVEIHAQALEQMLSGTHVVRPAYATGAELLFLIAAGAGLFWLIRRAGPVKAALIGAGSTGMVITLSWLAYAHGGVLFDPIYPTLVLVALYLTTTLVTYVITERERARVRSAFGHYIPPAIVDRIAHDPALLKLGGESREVTVLFADVRGFSRISEGMTAEQLIDFVNMLFSPLTSIIYEEGGTVDKYMGDAVMAFWNAPLDMTQHPLRAAKAALRMQAELNQINAALAALATARGATPVEVRLGIGLNTGPCVVGNVGSEQRKNYSILGDVVNVAARLEEATKSYGVPIIMGEKTAAGCPGLAVIEIDQVAPRGKDKPERLFALLGDEVAAGGKAFAELQKVSAEISSALGARNGAAALAQINAARALNSPGIEPLIAAWQKRGKTASGGN